MGASSNPPDWLGPLSSALRDLAGLLSEPGAQGIVIGGVAASALGKPRFTHDIDLTTAIADEEIAGFLDVAVRHNFATRIADAEAFARRSRMILLVHEPSQVEVDVAIAGLPFETEAIGRAWHVNLAGEEIAVASPEDLVIMKAVAGRPADLEDIRNILECHPDLDRRRVEMYLEQFAEALDTREIITRFEDALARLKRDRRAY